MEYIVINLLTISFSTLLFNKISNRVWGFQLHTFAIASCAASAFMINLLFMIVSSHFSGVKLSLLYFLLPSLFFAYLITYHTKSAKFTTTAVSANINISKKEQSEEFQTTCSLGQAVAPEQTVNFEQDVVSEQSLDSEQDVVSEQSLNSEQDVVSEQSLGSEQPIVSEQSLVSEQPIVSEQSLNSEQDVVSEQSLDSEQAFVSEQSLVSEQDVVSEQSLDSEQDVVSEQSLDSEQDVVSEQSLDSEQDVVSEQSLNSEQAIVSEQTVMSEQAELDSLLDRALLHKQNNNSTEALKVLSTAIKLYSNNDYAPFILIEIGNILRSAGAYDDVIEIYSQGLALPAIKKDYQLRQDFINTIAYLRILKNILITRGLGFVKYENIPSDIHAEIDSEFREWRVITK
ncbi:tetratricopeptide repeat protein [Dendrosporobacter sp. 1207_IL3150]|uniref:tetratricopeptide repeat protein n=1 Tax=Dendrosporobacter sp. 1207_IL3150 TaxID=3084054 RepID=UPI002FD8EEDE